MSYRVTGAEVKEIINTSLTVDEVNPFIAGANALITGKCSSTYTATELKELERWLAAHFVAVRDPVKSAYTRQSIAGGPAQDYQLTAKNPVGLATTAYGQQVLILDYENTLAGIGVNQATTFWRVLGPSNEDFD